MSEPASFPCLDIAVNGAPYCRAGVGRTGILSAFITHYLLPPPEGLPDPGPRTWLHVTGTTPDGRAVYWRPVPSLDHTIPLALGDIVTIRVVAAADPDPPFESA